MMQIFFWFLGKGRSSYAIADDSDPDDLLWYVFNESFDRRWWYEE